ncbi:MAG: hypothetical protein M1826_006467 [Phylliscum demangeonii]|nr:MAG: hypothetical protein M1826_006467 [Phylliscum demangeonii]
MASEEDNFDIDVYGDGEEEKGEDVLEVDTNLPDVNGAYKGEVQEHADTARVETGTEKGSGPANTNPTKDAPMQDQHAADQAIATAGTPVQGQVEIPKQAPRQQGTKRKEGPDDRAIDSGATLALFISDLNWWSTDDDIRGWINQSDCEDELKDITFNEHKVNGKSKGQAYVVFTSPQAATAVKRKLEAFNEGQQHAKRHHVAFAPAMSNPYRTLPKENATRGKDGPRTHENRASGGYGTPGGLSNGHHPGSMNFNMHHHSYRGGRGNYNNRGGPGGAMNHMGASGYPNRSFSGPMGAVPPVPFPGPPMPAYPPAGMPMGAMPPPYGGYPARGGMMTGGIRGGNPMGIPRGGRGGMGGPPNGMMGGPVPMGGMMGGMPGPMGAMSSSMGMGPMGMQVGGPVNHHPMNMGQGPFPGPQAHYNPAFFNQSQQPASGDGSWNPHGTKRQRPE